MLQPTSGSLGTVPENQHLSKGLGPNLTPCKQYQALCVFFGLETWLNTSESGSNIALVRSTSLKMEDTLKW